MSTPSDLLYKSYATDTSFSPVIPKDLELRPFQKAAVEYGLDCGGRVILADPPGCVSGDTEIRINRAGRSKRYTIRQFHNEKFKINKRSGVRFNSSIPSRIRSAMGDHIGLNTVIDIIYSGLKDTVLLKTEKHSIVLTPDHEVLTQRGDVAARDLTAEDSVIIDDLSRHQKKENKSHRKIRYLLRAVGAFHPYRRKKKDLRQRKEIYVQDTHRLAYEAEMNGLSLDAFIAQTHLPNKLKYVDPAEFVIHHVDHNPKNNAPENLKMLTYREHYLHHGATSYSNFAHGEVKYESVISVTDHGVTDTYDIVCSDPHRNFIANGIAVHNCGKTIEAIALMNSAGIKKYLVISPASLLDNWKREINRWSTLAYPPHIYTTGSVKNPKDSILILSYGLCSNVEVLQRILSSYQFDGLVVDEMHFLKGMDAARTKNILGINGPFDRAGCIACLSGTPIVNKPIDLWPIVNRMKPGILGCKNYREFGEHFANAKFNPFTKRTEYVGSKNEEELGRLLRSSLMIRREKSEVLKDLPPKTRRAIYLSSDESTRELVNSESELYDDFLKNKKLELDKVNSSMRVRVQLAAMKAPQVIEYCKLILETEHKLLVFAYHRILLTELIIGLAQYNVRALTGATSPTDRQRRVDEFQDDPDVRVFIGALDCAGVGLTLTAASHVVMCEASWIPGTCLQAEDRVHRIGQRDHVMIDYVIYPNSVDERVLQVIGKKNSQIDLVLR